MKNTQIKHTFPCTAGSPAYLSPVVITLCSPLWGHGAPRSTFSRMSLYLSSAIEGIGQKRRHRDSRTDGLIVPQVPAGARATPVQPAGQLLICCSCGLLPSSPNLPAP